MLRPFAVFVQSCLCRDENGRFLRARWPAQMMSPYSLALTRPGATMATTKPTRRGARRGKPPSSASRSHRHEEATEQPRSAAVENLQRCAHRRDSLCCQLWARLCMRYHVFFSGPSPWSLFDHLGAPYFSAHQCRAWYTSAVAIIFRAPCSSSSLYVNGRRLDLNLSAIRKNMRF